MILQHIQAKSIIIITVKPFFINSLEEFPQISAINEKPFFQFLCYFEGVARKAISGSIADMSASGIGAGTKGF
jgi:hypothetical protein